MPQLTPEEQAEYDGYYDKMDALHKRFDEIENQLLPTGKEVLNQLLEFAKLYGAGGLALAVSNAKILIAKVDSLDVERKALRKRQDELSEKERSAAQEG